MMMLLAGLALLVALRLAIRDGARSTRLFIVLWPAVSIGNLLVGVRHAGYGWAEEVAIGLLVFGAPAALSLVALRFRR